MLLINCVAVRYLEPGTTVFFWLFGETTVFIENDSEKWSFCETTVFFSYRLYLLHMGSIARLRALRSPLGFNKPMRLGDYIHYACIYAAALWLQSHHVSSEGVKKQLDVKLSVAALFAEEFNQYVAAALP